LYSNGGVPPFATAVHVMAVPYGADDDGDEVRDVTVMGSAAMTLYAALLRVDSYVIGAATVRTSART